MIECRCSKKRQRLIYIVSPILIALTGWLLTILLMAEHAASAAFFLLAPLIVSILVYSLILIIDTIYGKVIIADGKLSIRNILTNQSLNFHEIRGYLNMDQYISIIPENSDKKVRRVDTSIEHLD